MTKVILWTRVRATQWNMEGIKGIFRHSISKWGFHSHPLSLPLIHFLHHWPSHSSQHNRRYPECTLRKKNSQHCQRQQGNFSVECVCMSSGGNLLLIISFMVTHNDETTQVKKNLKEKEKIENETRKMMTSRKTLFLLLPFRLLPKFSSSLNSTFRVDPLSPLKDFDRCSLPLTLWVKYLLRPTDDVRAASKHDGIGQRQRERGMMVEWEREPNVTPICAVKFSITKRF